MKKVLFWTLYIPIGLWILFWGCLTDFSDEVDMWTTKWTDKFEDWCFPVDKKPKS